MSFSDAISTSLLIPATRAQSLHISPHNPPFQLDSIIACVHHTLTITSLTTSPPSSNSINPALCSLNASLRTTTPHHINQPLSTHPHHPSPPPPGTTSSPHTHYPPPSRPSPTPSLQTHPRTSPFRSVASLLKHIAYTHSYKVSASYPSRSHPDALIAGKGGPCGFCEGFFEDCTVDSLVRARIAALCGEEVRVSSRGLRFANDHRWLLWQTARRSI